MTSGSSHVSDEKIVIIREEEISLLRLILQKADCLSEDIGVF